MSKLNDWVVALTVALLTSTPLMAAETPFPAVLGETYAGRLTAELFPVEGGRRIQVGRGTAEISFTPADDGTVHFVTKGVLDDNNSFELSTLLDKSEDGIWRSFSPTGMTQINAAGELLSITNSRGFELILTGTFEGNGGDVSFRRVPTAEAPRDESEYTAVYSLEVTAPQAEPDLEPGFETEAAAADDGGCKEVGWHLVNRWNPFGGGLSLTREPYCIRH